MTEYPWGPHGPRVDGPPSVTPNPTPSYVEPSWPSSAPGGNPGGGYAQPVYSVGVTPNLGVAVKHEKKLWLAIPLAWFFGPFGLLYAIGDSKPQLLALAGFFAWSAYLHFSSYQPPVHLFHPMLIVCVVWSIFAAKAYNRRQKDDKTG